MKDVLFCLRFLGASAWRLNRRLLVVGSALLLLGAIATPVVALGLREMVDAVVGRQPTAAGVAAAVVASALVAELMMGHFAHLYYYELAEATEVALNRRLVRLINGTRRLDQTEDPAFADGVDLLREDVVKSRETVQSAMQLLTIAVQTALTAVVLATVQPVLLVLPLIAAIPLLLGKRAEQALQKARASSAGVARQVRYLRELAVTPASQKEVRLSGAQTYLIERHLRLQHEMTATMSRGLRKHAALRAVGQLVFAAAYLGSVLLVYEQARRGQAGVGDVVLVIALATQVSGQVATGLELLGSTYATAAGLRRFAALEDAGATTGDGGTPVTAQRLDDGIVLDRVGFTYPRSDRLVLDDVSLRLPAGAVVAVVGENGAGKSTLVKLLAGLYVPTTGRILVDGDDLAHRHVGSWRARTAMLFQDFAQFELTARESIGLGELSRMEDDGAIRAAVDRAEAQALLERLNGDLGTLLGRGYGNGTELSGGQWQSVGFARTMMRDSPLVLSLDEPGHSLDALAEQRMCDAYQRAARDVATRVGGVTLFVTHRMSTVRMADLVVVLDGGRVAEVGTHEELVRAGGRYAALWALQSTAYR